MKVTTLTICLFYRSIPLFLLWKLCSVLPYLIPATLQSRATLPLLGHYNGLFDRFLTLVCCPDPSFPELPECAFHYVIYQLRHLQQLLWNPPNSAAGPSSHGSGLLLQHHPSESLPLHPQAMVLPIAVTSACPDISQSQTWSGSSLSGMPFPNIVLLSHLYLPRLIQGSLLSETSYHPSTPAKLTPRQKDHYFLCGPMHNLSLYSYAHTFAFSYEPVRS